MPAPFDVEKEDARFLIIFRRSMAMIAFLVGVYLTVSTAAILRNNPGLWHDWRGSVCILLASVALLLYCVPTMISWKLIWPVPLPLAVSIGGGIYLTVLVLSFINQAFLWDFYLVFSVGLALFVGWQAVLAVSIVVLTLFAFQGLLIWPLSGDALLSMVSQSLLLFSMTGLMMLFQHLTGERFERNRLVKQLAQRNRELEDAHRQLAQAAVQGQELAVLRERTRLAREMHDTIGHALVLISVKLEAAQRLRERDPERSNQEMESTKQIARETMTALRASIADLRSPTLERERLSQAFNRTVRELAQRTGLHVTSLFQVNLDLLPEAVAEILWKVSQEAFTNIEKHARASQVHVQISQQDENLLLVIHDDGVGFPQITFSPQSDGGLVDNQLPEHYGLRGMRERAEALGGHLTLCSGKEQGTTIEIALPLASWEPVLAPLLPEDLLLLPLAPARTPFANSVQERAGVELGAEQLIPIMPDVKESSAFDG